MDISSSDVHSPVDLSDDAAANDPVAQLEACSRDVWCYVLHSVRNRADAEDLYQEVQLKALKNLDTVQAPDRFRSWVFSIAMNTVRSFFRKRKPLSLDDGPDGPSEPLPDPGPSPQSLLERRQHLAIMRRALAQLPERDREVLLLDVMAELPQKDIAERLDLNLNTVKTITRRAKIKLARIMAEVTHG